MSQALSLRQSLDFEPVPLRFGTSGRRGRVTDLTQLEIYLNALAELEYLQTLPAPEGGIRAGDPFFFACDLRPSSSKFRPEADGRGEIAQTISRAIADAGMKPVFCGAIPTPALAFHAWTQGKGSIMVTGSHIPFDRNGYKTNTARRELLKADESPIQARVAQLRERLYAQPVSESPFDSRGMFKSGHQKLPEIHAAAGQAYLARYTDFFSRHCLRGLRLLVYEHSAVGRDLLTELLRQLGAEVIPAGRSETFVPIDTENMDDAQLRAIETLTVEAWTRHGPLHAVVSTDGDSDRPLLLGVEAAGGDKPCRVRFFPGDLLGMVTAEHLGADAVVVPISCNDAVDRGALRDVVEPKTRIGSPFVIAGMEAARAKGRHCVCGWEANGGFLTGSDIVRASRTLRSLPTRDAFLPILATLSCAVEKGVAVSALFDALPRRFGRAALLRNFPRTASHRLIRQYSPGNETIREVDFEGDQIRCLDASGRELMTESSGVIGELTEASAVVLSRLRRAREILSGVFSRELGFGEIRRLNFTDGIRIYFANGEVTHVRASGNADELRIYAVADTPERVEAIVRLGAAEPDGLLRRLEKAAHEEAVATAMAEFKAQPGLRRFEGVVQHYAWGGFEFIADLLNRPQWKGKPCAEYWMGSHPKGPATVREADLIFPLSELLGQAADQVLGREVATKFQGALPYLFKVLDARQMLSIQAHPSREQAAVGFEREESAGIPPDAPNRNYRDRNHKPEVHVALTPLWMLHGFRPLGEIATLGDSVPELAGVTAGLSARLAQAGADRAEEEDLLRGLYQKIMTMPQAEVDKVMNPLLDRLRRSPTPPRQDPAFWVLRAAEQFPSPNGVCDRGLLSIYLLNLIQLQPGQGTFQPARALHAYLEGATIELMANSDNVLRGGLTSKHVDVPELMRILQFTSSKPEIISARAISPCESVYPTPAEEFELSRICLGSGAVYREGSGHGPVMLLVLEGAAQAVSGGQALPLKRGEAVLAPHAATYELRAEGEDCVIFKAATPSLI